MPLNCKMTSPLDRPVAMRFEVVRLNSVADRVANSRNSYGAPVIFFTFFFQRTAQSLAMPLNCKMISPLDRPVAMRFEWSG